MSEPADDAHRAAMVLVHDEVRRMARWGRWGIDDQRGAVNLVGPDKIRQAASLVRVGRSVSLQREYPKVPAGNNQEPAQHFVGRWPTQDGFGMLCDYIGMSVHGVASTHLDALCHMWGPDGMWNGRDPDVEVERGGSRWGDIAQWSSGITTRGVLIDVAGSRRAGHVEEDEPVTATELYDLCRRSGVVPTPGDAIVLNCGRESWEVESGLRWGEAGPDGKVTRPGLDLSCAEFFYEMDPSLLVWDMHDCHPNSHGSAQTTHAVLYSQGIGLLDNAALADLVTMSGHLGRHDFMLSVAPLKIVGGTGSPVNPIAVF